MAVVKLTPGLLKRFITEEKSKMFGTSSGDVEDVDADELDADEFGTDKALENPIDHIKAMKIKEARIVQALRAIIEAKKKSGKKMPLKTAAQKKKDEAAKKKKKDEAAKKKKKSKLDEAFDALRVELASVRSQAVRFKRALRERTRR